MGLADSDPPIREPLKGNFDSTSRPTFLDRSKQLAIIATGIVACIYLGYRVLFTLNISGPVAITLSTALWLGETYGIFLLMLHLSQLWRRYDPPDVTVAPGQTVDVFIPTLDESLEILRPTISAAAAMDHPHRTVVLDDGNRQSVRNLCRELNVAYQSRTTNEGYKAGNLNRGLRTSQSELVALLDADHIAQPDFLVQTLGHFADNRVAFVQTPHAIRNLHNIAGWYRPSRGRYWDQDMVFYHVVQPGKNFWNAATFCGSAAVLRRAALDDVGGFATETITEDLHTGLKMHARGWRSLFVDQPLVFGLASTDGKSYAVQRTRWCRGNLSVMRYDNPLTMSGLSLGQRVAYLSSMLNWTHGWAKLPLYVTPPLMLFTEISPVVIRGQLFIPLILVYLTTLWTTIISTGNGLGRPIRNEFAQIADCGIQIVGSLKTLLSQTSIPFRTTFKSDPSRQRSSAGGGAASALAANPLPIIILLLSITALHYRMLAGIETSRLSIHFFTVAMD